MALKLTEREINTRLQKLRNYERLYPRLKRRCEKLERENKELRRALEQERRERLETVEALKLQIEELREMVFGRKRGGDHPDAVGGKPPVNNPPTEKAPRSPASYRRPTPKNEDVTQESFHGIEHCPACGEALTQLKEAVRYLEDIVLPALSGLETVERQRIETGFCPQCRKWRSAIPIGKQVCSLGENVRHRIVYCITVLGMTFEKVERDLRDTFGITVGNGEVTRILTAEAAKLLPEYHAIDAKIRDAPCRHLDETGWPVQKEGEGNFGWVKTASNTPDTIFRLGRSRGKGNAKILLPDRDQPTVTDDYAAYDDCADKQGLCWAHPKWKFQDLAESKTLAGDRQEHCREFYKRFCVLLHDVGIVVASPYNRPLRDKHAEEFRTIIANLCAPNHDDPKKLSTLKATFLANTERYLLCVREPKIPMTNNKAERSIRPLVLKRKVSFGSKTQKGADVMSILLSVCMTTWWRKPENFYAAYRAILQKWQGA